MPIIDIGALAADLTNAQARWTARQTPHSLLSDDEKKALLGNDITADDQALAAAPRPVRPRRPSRPSLQPSTGGTTVVITSPR